MELNRTNLATKARKLSDLLEWVALAMGMPIFLTMVISVLLGVWYRYVLLRPLLFTDELAIYCMIWMGFLAMGIGIKQNEHPYIEIIVQRLPRWITPVLNVLVTLAMLVLFVVLVIVGYEYAVNSGKWRSTNALGISMVLPLLSVPVGSLFAFLQLLLRQIYGRYEQSEQ